MYTISLNDSAVDFKTLEQTIYRTVCEIACDVLKDGYYSDLDILT